MRRFGIIILALAFWASCFAYGTSLQNTQSGFGNYTETSNVTADIAGTADQVIVTDDGDGTITLSLDSTLAGIDQYKNFTIFNPNAVYADDTEVQIWVSTPTALTITRIEISLNAAGNEIAGDLKYADDFISLANPVVINSFNTTSGVLDDNTIATGAVPAGKVLYLAFSADPNALITQAGFLLTYDND